jgi:hypothetical protein
MPFINLPPSLFNIFQGLEGRLQKLETGKRFTMPAVTTDPAVANAVKGDIWLNTTSNTPKYLDATGAVATFGGGSSTLYGVNPKVGYNYSPVGYDSSNGTTLPAPTGQINLIPFYLASAATAKALTVFVQTAVAGATAQVGIYSNATSGDYPNALISGSTGTLTTSTTGTKTATINVSLAAGLYWLAYQQITGATASSITASYGNLVPYLPLPNSTTATPSTANNVAWYQNGLGASLPSTFAGTGLTNVGPTILIGF